MGMLALSRRARKKSDGRLESVTLYYDIPLWIESRASVEVEGYANSVATSPVSALGNGEFRKENGRHYLRDPSTWEPNVRSHGYADRYDGKGNGEDGYSGKEKGRDKGKGAAMDLSKEVHRRKKAVLIILRSLQARKEDIPAVILIE